LPIVINYKYNVKASSRTLKLFIEVFIALLLTAVRGKNMVRVNFVLSWQFSRELPTPERAGALGLNGSHALGDGQIQLKVRGAS